MQPAYALAAFGIVAATTVGALVWTRVREQRRTEALRDTCGRLGFTWLDREVVARPDALPLLRRGRSNRTLNAMRGKLHGVEVIAADHTYVTGAGKNKNTCRQTLALIPRIDRAFPDFELAPENVLLKLAAAFGYQDIDFEGQEEFSKRYVLRGTDEAAIRRAFAPGALAYLAERPGLSVEKGDDALVVYRAHRRCPAEELRALLESAVELAKKLGLSRGA